MKISDFLEHRQRDEEEAEERRRVQLRTLLQYVESKSIDVYVPPDPKIDKTYYTGVRINLRDQLREGKTYLIPDIECDHCATPLINRQVGTMTLGSPSQIYVGCPGCGWLGYFPV